MNYQKMTNSADETMQLAKQLGAKLKGGEIIELSSDLGGGKTKFVQGLVAGMGSSDQVTSPSFTLKNEYQAGELTVHHFDFYRLEEPGIMQNMLSEVIDDNKAVVTIEWGGLVKDVLPPNRLQIAVIATGENSREINFTYPDSLNYIFTE